MREIPIVFEDEAICAIDKPSGITVNRSENEKGETIEDWARLRQGFRRRQDYGGQVVGQAEEISNSEFYKRAGIVHRLDKETSGILLIAKNEDVFHKLQQQFVNREVSKVYTALVHGRMETAKIIIKNKVGRLPWNRRLFGVIEEGREAETEINVVNYYQDKQNNPYTLVNVFPRTGRTHQIRIHLKHIKHPILSDPLYAGRIVLRQDLKICRRLFLHAGKIEFKHPGSGQKMILESQLPDDLVSALNSFTPVG